MDPDPSMGARPRSRVHAASGADPIPADPVTAHAADPIRANCELWDSWTELHVPSRFYDVEGFKAGRETPDAVELEGVSYSWQHPFEEIVGSLVEAGLVVTSLREYPYLFWRWFPWMVEDGSGSYRLPAGMPEIPLMFSLTAGKPGETAPEGPTVVGAGSP